MSKKLIFVKVLSYNSSLVRGYVKQISLPAANGRMVILPNHIPLISGLERGDIILTMEDGEKQTVNISKGFVRFNENICSITVHQETLLKAAV